MKGTRTDADYTIDALLKGLRVLEALEGTRLEPVTIKRIEQRTKLPYDTCMRSLRTLKVAGFAEQTPAGWTLGNKFLTLSDRFNELCMTALSTQAGGDLNAGES